MSQLVGHVEEAITVCERNGRGDFSLNKKVLDLLYGYYASKNPCSFDFAANPDLFVFLRSYHDYHGGEDHVNRSNVVKYLAEYQGHGCALPNFVSRRFDILRERGELPLPVAE